MTRSPRRSRIGSPYRHLRRWARHTPNSQIAASMIIAGAALLAIAVALAYIVF